MNDKPYAFWSPLVCLVCLGIGACTAPAKPAAPVFTGYTGEPEFISDPGEMVETQFSWRVGIKRDTGRRQTTNVNPHFRWCVTSKRGALPSGSNTCYEFDSGSISCSASSANSPLATLTCTGDVTLLTSLAGVSSDWYVRAENPADQKSYANSNARPVDWQVRTLNATFRKIEIETRGVGGVELLVVADVLNTGQAPLKDVVVRFSITLDDGTTQVLPETSDQTISSIPLFFSNGDTGEGNAGVTIVPAQLGISRPFDVQASAIIDPDNAIQESNEGDNSGSQNKRIH